MGANLGPFSIGFGGNSNSQAANGSGILGPYQITPGTGTDSTDPADYGLIFSTPQNIVIPPIDLSSLGVSGLGTLDLGTLSAVNLDVALRNVVINLDSPILPTTGGGTYPQHFDSTQVAVSVSGTADMALTASLKQSDLVSYLATGVALNALKSTLSGQGVSLTLSGSSASQLLQGIFAYQVGFSFSTALPTIDTPNNDASQGTIAKSGSNYTLTLPVKFDITPTTLPSPINTLLTADFTMSGNLVGTATAAALPEPSSIALAAMGLCGMAGLARRRRKK